MKRAKKSTMPLELRMTMASNAAAREDRRHGDSATAKRLAAEQWPEKEAELVWEKDGLRFSLLHHFEGLRTVIGRDLEWYTGYVRFPRSVFRVVTTHGLVNYVPVHGGITFVQEYPDGSVVYGFDTHHAFDEDRAELRDQMYLKKECELLGYALRVFGHAESQYRRRRTSSGKARFLDQVMQKAHLHLTRDRFGFGAMLNALTGEM